MQNATESEKKKKTLYHMHREITSLKGKFKNMEERKSAYCVKEGDEPQINYGDQFGVCKQKRDRIGD